MRRLQLPPLNHEAEADYVRFARLVESATSLTGWSDAETPCEHLMRGGRAAAPAPSPTIQVETGRRRERGGRAQSFGSPRTRSARMLRMISDVPPWMVLPRERSARYCHRPSSTAHLLPAASAA